MTSSQGQWDSSFLAQFKRPEWSWQWYVIDVASTFFFLENTHSLDSVRNDTSSQIKFYQPFREHFEDLNLSLSLSLFILKFSPFSPPTRITQHNTQSNLSYVEYEEITLVYVY